MQILDLCQAKKSAQNLMQKIGAISLVGIALAVSILLTLATTTSSTLAQSPTETVPQQALGINLDSLRMEAEHMLLPAPVPVMQVAMLDGPQYQRAGLYESSPREAIGPSLIDRVFINGKPIASNGQRETAIELVMAETGKSREEARLIINRWIKSYRAAHLAFEQNKQALKAAAKAKAKTAAAARRKQWLLAFLGFLLASAGVLLAVGLFTRRSTLLGRSVAA